jgi:hypothetical protein
VRSVSEEDSALKSRAIKAPDEGSELLDLYGGASYQEVIKMDEYIDIQKRKLAFWMGTVAFCTGVLL